MPRLLCIDDQEDSLLVRKMFLESQGHNVLIATSGRQGLQMLADNAVDVLILDYRMPEMDGEEVAVEARRSRPDLPIVVLSGYISELPDTLRRTANALVIKGAPVTELLETIARFTGESSKTPQANTASAVLDVSRSQVSRSQKQVQANVYAIGRNRAHRSRHR